MLDPKLTFVIKAARNQLLKSDHLLISEWAAKYRHVSTAESVRPGQWDNSIFPFAVEIMDSACDPFVEEITMIGSAQVCKTEILKNIVGYYMAHDPQKILILEPTEIVGRAFSIDKLEPMINANEVLRNKIIVENRRDNTNTKLHKVYIGGSLTIVGSSPNALAQRSVKIVISDDIDRMPESAGEEGDPVKLAEERTESYSILGFKHIRFSTPTIKGVSRIEKLFLKSDQREYYVPCPYCNHFQTLKFERLQWEKEEIDLLGTLRHLPDTTKYLCENESCNELIEEKHKDWMLKNGKWIPKFPEIKKHRGYWINRLYSPFSIWSSIVKKYLDAKDDPEEYKVFTNTSLAQTWEQDEFKEIDETYLFDRCEDYLTEENPYMPNGVLMLVAAIDTHPDRLELKVKGFGIGWESWLIHYEKLWGDPDQEDVWNALDLFWTREWERQDRIKLKIVGAFIDSGGSNTESVYNYCQRRQHKNIIAIKGIGGWGKPLLLNVTRVGKNRNVILQNIGVDNGKEIVMSRLQIEPADRFMPKARYMHFTSAFANLEYFKGLTSERVKKIPDRRLGYKMEWRRKSYAARNEPLDLEVYCIARAKSFNPNFEAIKEKLEARLQEVEQNKTEDHKPILKRTNLNIKRKSFVNNWK